MIHFKNQRYKGFSFIEAIIALAIIAAVVSSFFLLQQKVFYRVVVNRFKIDRLPLLQNMMISQKALDFDAMQQHENQESFKKIEKKIIDPETHLVYEKIPVSTDSVLARFQGLYQERVTAEWIESGKKRIIDLYHYGFEIEEKKSETR